MTQHTEPKAEFASAGTGYGLPVYGFELPPELAQPAVQQLYPVVIVGAGLAGLTLGVDLLQRGVPVVIVDEDNTVGVKGASSRGICYAQKSLEIFARLGIYERIAAKGVQWQVGRTLDGDDEVYAFDLRQSGAHNVSQQPPFINIQQYYIEWFLVERFLALAPTVAGSSLRWKTQVKHCSQSTDIVSLQLATPQGQYTLAAQWLADCSGVHSGIRNGFGLNVNAAQGEDRWCISDVRFKTQPPTERWTWIQAPFNDNRAVWQHLMADGVWRLDYQMAADTDMVVAASESVVTERLRRQFGEGVDFELVWVGPYGYRSQCLDDFQHGRVLFVGDVAHVMSPFGARGGNSAIQDADNLGWKLAALIQGAAGSELLRTYSQERVAAACENIEITRRTMRFLAPKPGVETTMRNAVLGLAKQHTFARQFVNTGRMSVATAYTKSSLNVGAGAGRHVQNVVLHYPENATQQAMAKQAGRSTDLVQLMKDLNAGVLLVFSKQITAQEINRLLACIPTALKPRALVLGRDVIDSDNKLAMQLNFISDKQGKLSEAMVAIVRPDLYCAGVASADDAEQMITLFVAALGLNQ